MTPMPTRKMYPMLDERIYYGVPGSTMSGIIGKTASLIVVDDPHDYVVPSDGVEIVGRLDHGKDVLNIAMHDMQFRRDVIFDSVGGQRSQMGKTKAVDAVMKKQAGPSISAKRAKMSGIKGLR